MQDQLTKYTCPTGVSKTDFDNVINLHYEIVKNQSRAIPSAGEVAKKINMSPQKFRNLFQKIFNANYYVFYQEMRLEHAKVLLKDNEFSIVQIAYKVGFNYSQNFARAFHKYTGMTAKTYRELKNEYNQ
jgi:AraC-like DNA-binding protein